MKAEFRVSIEASHERPAEKVAATLRDLADAAEHEAGITVDVAKVKTEAADHGGFETGGEYGHDRDRDRTPK